MSEDLSLSEELRRAREARGESLDQIHQRTGIALKILQGLENGEFDVVEPVYARLAINHYAVCLGLDGKAFEQRLYDDVDATRPPLVLVQTSPASAIHSLPEPSPLADLIRSQPPARLATIGVILVVGLAILLYLLSSDAPPPPRPTVTPTACTYKSICPTPAWGTAFRPMAGCGKGFSPHGWMWQGL